LRAVVVVDELWVGLGIVFDFEVVLAYRQENLQRAERKVLKAPRRRGRRGRRQGWKMWQRKAQARGLRSLLVKYLAFWMS
jgi:hypothetical protein